MQVLANTASNALGAAGDEDGLTLQSAHDSIMAEAWF
jgi:hypothetical protein